MNASRIIFIDVLKTIASQLVVLHHLVFYGQISETTWNLAPAVFAFLSNEARMIVQVFLVISGFFTANLLLRTVRKRLLFKLLIRRYLKLGLPFWAAILFSIPCAYLARLLLQNAPVPEFMPSLPSLTQLLAHAFLLQDVLGKEALIAGAWYVAIDFQLFLLIVLILFCTRLFAKNSQTQQHLILGLTLFLALLSLFYCNRYVAWDFTGLYFFASYALGIFAYWNMQFFDKKQSLKFCSLMFIVFFAALIVDFRPRILLSLCTAYLIFWVISKGVLTKIPLQKMFAFLGKISFSLFLTHFSVFVLINALFTRYVPNNAAWQALEIGITWFICLIFGALFYRVVEQKSNQFVAHLFQSTPKAGA